MWRARCSQENADTYETLLRSEILPELDSVPGCRGAYVLRRDVDAGVEFVVFHLFDSLDAIRSFAGQDYATAVVPDRARERLDSFDETAEHFEVRAEPVG